MRILDNMEHVLKTEDIQTSGPKQYDFWRKFLKYGTIPYNTGRLVTLGDDCWPLSQIWVADREQTVVVAFFFFFGLGAFSLLNHSQIPSNVFNNHIEKQNQKTVHSSL